MMILGIDFTSRPQRRKPLTCLECTLDGDRLVAGTLHEWTSFAELEAALAAPGPWVAGIDCPFGQSRRFIENIGWPLRWSAYVDHVGRMTRPEFRRTLDDYRKPRAAGDKEHRRMVDGPAGAISPQKLYGIPVGLMFYEGAPRLRRAEVTIPGVQAGDPERVVFEAYPGVIARHFIPGRSYKHDTKKKQTPERSEARQALFDALSRQLPTSVYRLGVTAPSWLADDPSGDPLDSLLCAIQAAWAWRRLESGHGAPESADARLEGWIADPNVVGDDPRPDR